MEILSSMELQFTNLRHTAATDEWHHFFEFVFQGFPEEYKLIFYSPSPPANVNVFLLGLKLTKNHRNSTFLSNFTY